jgi:hypothetical protein
MTFLERGTVCSGPLRSLAVVLLAYYNLIGFRL